MSPTSYSPVPKRLMESDRCELSLSDRCQDLTQQVETAVEYCGQNTESLLALLRLLEQLHRRVFNEHFVPSLPNSRQPLYALLREMETEGGWPYIPKMRIHELLGYLNAQDEATEPMDERSKHG